MSKTIRKKLKSKSSKLATQSTLAALAGTLLLSQEATAQNSNLVDVSSLHGIASAQVQADGSLLITTNSGQTYTLPAANFTSQNGQFLVPANFADDISAWAASSASAGVGGVSSNLLFAGAAIAAGIGLVAATSGGDDDDDVVAIVVDDAPAGPPVGTDGNDIFLSDGTFAIDGGEGIDTVNFSGLDEGVNIDLDLNTPNPGPESQDGAILDAPAPAGGAPIQDLIDIENVIGTDFDDVIFGNNEVNILEGGAGDDAFHSFGGADTIDGGEGSDTAIFTAVPVDVTVDLDDSGNATATGGDTLISIENLTGSNAGNDTLSGNSGANVLNGNAGNDTLTGEGGNDTLIGGDGDDVLLGGGGTDIIDGGAGIDTNSFAGIGAGVTATVAADGTGTAVYGQINESFTGIENLTGTDNNDVLTATGAAANTIFGGAGDDIIAGGGGVDILDGGAGNDTNSFAGIGVDVVADLAAGTAVYTAPSGAVISETFTNFENLTGFTGNDTLLGDANDNILTGAAGNDTLTGGAGDDVLIGGGGTDIIDGGAGIDTNSFAGIGAGVTATVAADGTGTAVYSQINESFTGIENLTGTDNNDVLTATGAAANTIFGGAGDDIIAGGGGVDILDGGAGNDTNSFAGIGVDVTASLADGTAVYTVPSGAVISETFTNFENLSGFNGNDTLTGDGNANILTGGGGNDTLNGGAGDDTLNGGAGNDTLDGGDGNDTAVYDVNYADFTSNFTVINNNDGTFTVINSQTNEGTDTLTNIENIEFLDEVVDLSTLVGTGNGIFINSGAASDTLSGGSGDDTINGGGGSDTLFGLAGNDVLNGNDGNDTIAGGGGTDIIDGGAGIDTNSFAGIGAGVTATVAADGTGTAVYGQINESFTGIENLTGTDNNDVLSATGAAANTIFGGAGDDIIAGGGGVDILDGGAGNDTNSFAGIGVDVTASLADSTAVYTAPSGAVISETFTNFENLTGFNGNDTLTGNAGANVLDGGAGNDTLSGGAGNDTLDGGVGNDTAIFADIAANINVTNNGDGTLTVMSALDGTDTLSNIENLVDSAGVAIAIPAAPAASASPTVTVFASAEDDAPVISNTQSDDVVDAGLLELEDISNDVFVAVADVFEIA